MPQPGIERYLRKLEQLHWGQSQKVHWHLEQVTVRLFFLLIITRDVFGKFGGSPKVAIGNSICDSRQSLSGVKNENFAIKKKNLGGATFGFGKKEDVGFVKKNIHSNNSKLMRKHRKIVSELTLNGIGKKDPAYG